jgi:hypothetical protein
MKKQGGAPLAAVLLQAKQLLQANDQQMAKHMRMDLERYKALEGGALVLPIVKRKAVRKNAERLLDICGINTEQSKPK